MKTMKFFVMASALAAMVGFSSCLNGGDYTIRHRVVRL